MDRVGVLGTKPYADEPRRAWIFRTVGYGHSLEFWKALVSEPRLVGYDDVLSIEHEDSLFSPAESMAKAAALLKEVMPAQPRGAIGGTDTPGGVRLDALDLGEEALDQPEVPALGSCDETDYSVR